MFTALLQEEWEGGCRDYTHLAKTLVSTRFLFLEIWGLCWSKMGRSSSMGPSWKRARSPCTVLFCDVENRTYCYVISVQLAWILLPHNPCFSYWFNTRHMNLYELSIYIYPCSRGAVSFVWIIHFVVCHQAKFKPIFWEHRVLSYKNEGPYLSVGKQKNKTKEEHVSNYWLQSSRQGELSRAHIAQSLHPLNWGFSRNFDQKWTTPCTF